jgi:FkbM family methyltransferase
MVNVFHAFPALLAELNVDPRHLVHVGAHEGQEMPYYRAAGFRHITLVEPIPALAKKLRNAWPDAHVVECACFDQPGEATLHVLRRTNMSTLLAPAQHDVIHDELRVPVRRLDELAPDANVAVIDAQGAELAVLRGTNLDALDLAVVETCTVPDPTMAAPYDQVVPFMADAGFQPVTHWTRDYAWVHRWARGRPSRQQGEIRDVVFVKENHA